MISNDLLFLDLLTLFLQFLIDLQRNGAALIYWILAWSFKALHRGLHLALIQAIFNERLKDPKGRCKEHA